MGEHCELMVKQWGITREAQDELTWKSHQNLLKAYDEGFFEDLISPFNGCGAGRHHARYPPRKTGQIKARV